MSIIDGKLNYEIYRNSTKNLNSVNFFFVEFYNSMEWIQHRKISRNGLLKLSLGQLVMQILNKMTRFCDISILRSSTTGSLTSNFSKDLLNRFLCCKFWFLFDLSTTNNKDSVTPSNIGIVLHQMLAAMTMSWERWPNYEFFLTQNHKF